jgi:hypothetical protein
MSPINKRKKSLNVRKFSFDLTAHLSVGAKNEITTFHCQIDSFNRLVDPGGNNFLYFIFRTV